MTETFINIGGELMPANLQPPQSELQGAFRKSGDGKRIVIDMPAARDIARDMLRAVRASTWPKIDAARNKALEDGEGMASVKERSAVLRGVTKDPRIDEARTPDELLSVVEQISNELRTL